MNPECPEGHLRLQFQRQAEGYRAVITILMKGGPVSRDEKSRRLSGFVLAVFLVFPVAGVACEGEAEIEQPGGENEDGGDNGDGAEIDVDTDGGNGEDGGG